MKIKRIFSLVLAFMLISFNSVYASGTSNLNQMTQNSNELLKKTLSEKVANNFKKLEENKTNLSQEILPEVQEIKPVTDRMGLYSNDNVRVIVELEGDSVAEYAIKNGISLSSMDTEKREEIKKGLEVDHNAVKEVLKNKLQNVKFRHDYKTAINGFSAEISKDEVDKLKSMDGVKKITIANVYYPNMSTAVDYTNAKEVWNNPELGYKGEGTVVAIIDTGIDYRHKDLVITDPNEVALTQDEVEAKVGTLGSGKYFTNKVPFGWNWADNNDQIIDIGEGASMHGMHVAGIVASNGDIKGVAPEAQLLAEKVFSNNQETGAFSDDIIAGINNAVEFDADVLNMSLGSSAGYVLPDDPEQAAIKNAVDNGIICAISAGNSAYMSNGYDYPMGAHPDTGLVGSPGLFSDSIQVAASNNTLVLYEHNINVDGLTVIGYGKDSWASLSGDLQLVSIGGKLGYPEDYDGIDVSGKVVLVQRGDLAFVDKAEYAMEQGAIGIIVYDQGLGYTLYRDQGGVIPFMLITNEDGLALENKLKDGPITLNVTETRHYVDSTSGTPTDFSSWGPTPDLGFKPEIMAPGGNIYSLANNDGYQYMSGTSMSSPHVAGGMALIAQYLKTKLGNENTRNFVELAKILAMNTAEPVKNQYGYEYQPRLQGAGMMKIDRAIETPVYITDESGNAGVTLKEIGKEKEFTLTLTNMTDTEEKYDVSGTVGTDYIWSDGYNSLISVYMTGDDYDGNHIATITPDNPTITVPAKGTATVTMDLNIEKAPRNIFVEGYVYFQPQSENVPQLSVPYFGFYGDWSEPDIIDPVNSPNTYFGYTGLISRIMSIDGDYYYSDVISPNNDGDFDKATPILSFLRNAKDFYVNIKDASGNVIRTVAHDEYLRKLYDLDQGNPTYEFKDSWAWDGKALNKETGNYGVVPDGEYTIELKTRVDYPNAKWQTLDLPVTVDATAPVIHLTNPDVDDISEDGTYNVQWTVDENGTGVSDQLIAIFEVDSNGRSTGNMKISDVDSSDARNMTIELPYKFNLIQVAVADNGMNFGTTMNDYVITNKAFQSPNAPKVVITPGNLEILDTRTVDVSGYIDSDTFFDGVLKINGKEVAVDKDNSFETTVEYENDGWADLQVEAYYTDLYNPADPSTEEYRTAWAYKYVIDTTTPELTINTASDVKGFIVNGQKYLQVKGNVKDATSLGYTLTANNDAVKNIELDDFAAINDNFAYTGPLESLSSENIMKFVATDVAGNEDSLDLVVNTTTGSSITVNDIPVEFTEISDYNGPVIDSVTYDDGIPVDNATIQAEDVTIVVNSTTSSVIGVNDAYINGRQATLVNGKYELNVPLNEGENSLDVKVVDAIGTTNSKNVTVIRDTVGPEIDLSMPQYKTSNSSMDITGYVDDMSGIESLTIDGEAVEIVNGEFSFNVDLSVGENEFEIVATDTLGQKTIENVTIIRVAGDININTNIVQNGDVRFDNAAYIQATADRPVTWNVTIKDENGVEVDTLTASKSSRFEQLWAPEENDPSGTYTVEFNVVDESGTEGTASDEFEVYNLPVKVNTIATADMQGTSTSVFEKGNVVVVDVTAENLEENVNGLMIVQVLDANDKPYAIRFAPVVFNNGQFEMQVGFDTYGTAKGDHKVQVYVWSGWNQSEPLSKVGTFTFTVE